MSIETPPTSPYRSTDLLCGVALQPLAYLYQSYYDCLVGIGNGFMLEDGIGDGLTEPS
jgi:hypothetical protein